LEKGGLASRRYCSWPICSSGSVCVRLKTLPFGRAFVRSHILKQYIAPNPATVINSNG
jgi:hypothetical protein